MVRALPRPHDRRQRLERGEEAIGVESPGRRYRRGTGRPPLARRYRTLERCAGEQGPAAWHRVGRRPGRRLRDDDVRPLRRSRLSARGAGDEPVLRVRLLKLRGGAAAIFLAGRRGGNQPPLSAVGRHAVDQLQDDVAVERAQLVEDDDLGSPHQGRRALARAQDLQAPACGVCATVRGSGSLPGFRHHRVATGACPGADARRHGPLQRLVGFEEQDRPAGGEVPQGRDQQGCSLARLDGAPNRDLLQGGIVAGVEHFGPRRPARPPRLPGPGTVGDDDVLFSPSSERAYTASGHHRTSTPPSAARFASAAVASP